MVAPLLLSASRLATIVIFACSLVSFGPMVFAEESDDSLAGESTDREINIDEVKQFIDPTRMISRIEYSYQANFLESDTKLSTHKLRPWFALNEFNALWVRIPFHRYSPSQGGELGGLSDLSVGWGFMLYENLQRRLTTVAGSVDLVVPTGSREKGTGFDTYLSSLAAFLIMNPSDNFPVYVTARYLRSIGGRKGGGEARTLELSLQTVHILPKGFYIAFVPTLIADFEHDFEVYAIGFGAGRALTKKLSLEASLVRHITGEETFSRGFNIGLTYLWGRDKE